jgi:hypothetical protein
MFDALNRPDQMAAEVPLKLILPIIREVLDYCAAEALENSDLAYDSSLDQVVYYFKPDSTATSLFDYLRGVEDIWIFQSCEGGES